MPPTRSLLCPNPTCLKLFDTELSVCSHLSTSNSTCSSWTAAYMEGLLNQIITDTHEQLAQEVENEEYNDANAPLEPLDGGQDAPLADPPPPSSQESHNHNPISSHSGLRKEYHTKQSKPNPHPDVPGANILQKIEDPDDPLYQARRDSRNIFYPFRSRAEWQVANWTNISGLSVSQISGLLKLDAIKESGMSFTSSEDLRSRIESLPAVPTWKHQEISIPGYHTKEPMVLYWRDGLEVIAELFANPIFQNCLETTPYKLFDKETNQRVYSEFMSADFANAYQDTLGTGRTLIGIIGASDKTPLTIGTGNKEMHPVLLSVANIDAGVRMKATSHSFSLAAYLPIPKFENVSAQEQSLLSSRVYHVCLDIITQSLKRAEDVGSDLSDPTGQVRKCHTPLVSWIADLPEQRVLSGVTSNQSPTSIATLEQFGDGVCYPRRTRDITLVKIAIACSTTDPKDLPAFIKTCSALGLNGVHQPFWRDWGRADPSQFLTPDALHQWHKFFFDHVVKWVINIMGGEELDRRMAAIQPRVGVRHWPRGVSKLKQCTGREHRDLEKILVVCAAGAVDDSCLRAIRAIIEFIFLAQGLLLYPEHFHAQIEALREFHHYKSAIVTAGGRRGKHGPIPHFNIPKLESMQGVVESAKLLGAAYQYTSDITERCHCTHVKKPWRSTNHRMPHVQCVRYMDRQEKCRKFELYTSLRYHGAGLVNEMVLEAGVMSSHYPEATWLSQVLPASETHSGRLLKKSLFSKVHHSSEELDIAFVVAKRADFKLSVAAASAKFFLLDLQGALGDYFVLGQSYSTRGGQRRSSPNAALPFQDLLVYNNFRMQQTSAQDSRILLPTRTVQALPPTAVMIHGRGNTVLIEDPSGDGDLTSSSRDRNLRVVQIRMIFQPVGLKPREGGCPIYFYGEFFKFSPAYRETVDGVTVFSPRPGIDMFVLEHHKRSGGARMGDIFPLTAVREIVELVPRFGEKMDKAWNSNNSLTIPTQFYMNNFSDKETFHAILSYQ